MEVQKEKQELLQWHPAFFAGIQIELQDEADNLIFENEHQLGTKPKEIDVLIIKKEKEKPIRKNIGRIFRKHNIIEYKSPEDNLSIDDFYKVYGYSCFYKTDVRNTNSIPIDEITISLICEKYPRVLIQHLREQRNYKVEKIENGIYYVIGDKIPIQIIVTKRLSEDENMWIKNLTNQLKKTDEAKKLIDEYGKHKKNPLYKSVMNIIIRANQETFEEVKTMCEALMELMKDEIEVLKQEAIEQGMAEGKAQGMAEGKAQGMAEGKAEGESRINALIQKLSETNRMDEIVKAANDREYQKCLFEEFGL